MKNNNLFAAFSLVILLSFTLTSCAAIGGIFKAGMWVGVIAIIVVVAIIIWIVSKVRK